MTTDNKTLADVRPGGRVRLGDGLRSELLEQAERLERMAAQDRETGESIEQALEAGEEYTPDDATDVAAGLQHDANRSEEIAALMRKAAAALSAQPSPGGQDVPSIDYEDLLDQAKDLIHCGCSVNGAFEWLLEQLTDGEALAARQPVEASEGGFRAAASRQTASAESNATAEALIAAARQLNKQPDSVALGEATEFCTENGARQPVGEPVGQVRTRVDGGFIAELFPGAADRVSNLAPLYTAPPAQQPAQVYLDGLDRALGETIGQRDQYHEVADELAGHIAAITGVDIGEHSSANCPWQNAIEAAEEYKPAQAVDLGQQQDAARWRAIAPHLSVEWDEDEMLKRWTWIDFKGDALSVPTRTRESYASVDEAMDAVIGSQAVGNG